MAISSQLIVYITVCIAVFSLGLSVYSNSKNVAQCSPQHTVDSPLKRSQLETDQAVTPEQEIVRLKGIVQSLMQTLVSYSMMSAQYKRSQLSSGITESRSYFSGTQPYHQVGVTGGGRSPMSIHNHANFRTTIGMGEFAAVLNGVEFWTRHNDYLLVQAARDPRYHATMPIEFPPVPPEVLAKPTIPEQIEEMRQFFRAWQRQDITIRDYRPYFRARICYLEGSWTTDSVELKEPFDSDRHFVDAATWKSLNDKNRFLFASGRKNNLENLPFLPSVIHDIYQQENYVITSPVARAISPLYYTDTFPRDLILNQMPRVNDADKVFVTLAQTAKGLFLNVIFGKAGQLVTGSANVNVTCNPTNSSGCDAATAVEWCAREARSCRPFTAGTSPAMRFTWSTGAGLSSTPGFTYGPLTGPCFSVTLNFRDVTGGLTGVVVRANATQNVTADFSQPITLEGCIGDPVPEIANFEYRILCAPVERDLKLNRFRVVDDTATQMSQNPPLSTAALETSRFAYFRLNPRDSDSFSDYQHGYELLDELMEAIPGKDNAGAQLIEKVGHEVTLYYNFSRGVMNTAYYSRFYASDGNDAMGRQQKRRGFNDNNLFAAMTTQAKVADLALPDPLTGELVRHKWSYAIPLEIIYSNPLSSWNPYDFAYVPEGPNSTAHIIANGRNGGFTPDKAYNGTAAREFFFWTPVEFFSNNSEVGDAADTSGDTVGVLDKNGVVRRVRASGHYITLPPIAGVGVCRQRYVIAPLAVDKNPGFMNARALRHLLATNQRQLLDARLNIGKATLPLWTNPSTVGNRHFHRVNVVGANVDRWDTGRANITTTVSEEGNGHTHSISILRTVNPAGGFFYTITDCDGNGPVCPDGHSKMCLTDQSC